MAGFKSVSNVVLYTAGEFIPRVLSFLLLPVLTKYLTTSDYGISSYITTAVTFLFVLTTLSVNTYALRTYYKIKSDTERKQLLGNLFIFLSGWGFFMLCIEAFLLPLLLNAFSIQVPFYPYFLFGLIINFFDVISIIPLVSYRVSENAKGFVILSVGRTIFQYFFVVLLVVFFKMGLFGSFLGRLLGCIPFVFIYFFIIKRKGIFLINKNQIKQALLFSLPLLPGALSYLVISMFDRIILERYVSLDELGLYSVASTLALTLNIIIQGIYRSFEQKIFREHNNEGYSDLTDKLYKTYLAALCVPGFCIILFAKEILLVFTSPQYYTAERYVVYLVVAVIISGINTFFSTLLIADNQRKIISYTSVAAGILSFIINLIFIKYFGVLGACIASVLSFLFVYIIYCSRLALLNKYIIHQISFAAIFFIAYYTFNLSLPFFTAIIIKVLVLLAFVCYMVKVINLELFSSYKLKFLKIFKR